MGKDWGGEWGEEKQHQREAEHCSESTEQINRLSTDRLSMQGRDPQLQDKPALSTIFRKSLESEYGQTFIAHQAIALH